MTAITSGDTPLGAGTSAHEESLARRLARIRTRSGRGDWDRLMLYVGGALLPLGVLVVILGWLGASHTVLLCEQIPYLISGGQIGQSLVFAGGFIYFTYWLTLLVRESRSRHEEMITALGRLETAMLARGNAAADQPTGQVPAVVAAPALLVATRKGNMAHLPDCQVVAGRDDLRPVNPGTAGLVPCKLCQPED